MTRLRLHSGIYSRDAVDQVALLLRDYGQVEVSEADGYMTVALTAVAGVDEAELAGEFANHALVATLQEAA